MATAETTVQPRLSDHLREFLRTRGDIAAGWTIWALITVFIVWAALDERDALVVGMVSGSIFALGAVGLTLIYGVLKFGHFAHGDAMMMSSYVAFFFIFGHIIGARQVDEVKILPLTVADLPSSEDTIWRLSFGYGLLVAMALAAVIMAALFIGIDRVVYRTLRKRKSGIVMFSIAALGLAIAIRSLVLMFFGPNPRLYAPGIRERVSLPFDIHVLADQIFIFVAALSVTALVYLLLYRTKLGKAMRATADNPDLALVSGINADRIIMWTWAVAGALVAVAGVLLALQAQLDPQIGFVLLLPIFASAILGGVGKPQGALVGGMIVGMVQEVAVTVHLDFIRTGFPGPGYKFSVAFIILILILLLRPRGLFGDKQ